MYSWVMLMLLDNLSHVKLRVNTVWCSICGIELRTETQTPTSSQHTRGESCLRKEQTERRTSALPYCLASKPHSSAADYYPCINCVSFNEPSRHSLFPLHTFLRLRSILSMCVYVEQCELCQYCFYVRRWIRKKREHDGERWRERER